MKRMIIMVLILSTIICGVAYGSSDTTSDLLAIYDGSIYTPSSSDIRAFNSEMQEYDKLIKEEKKIQSYNNSVGDAQEQVRSSVHRAQLQIQNLLIQSSSCSEYIEENIYGDFDKLVQKDAEYKQCYYAADSLLERINKMDIPPLLMSKQTEVEEKEKALAEKKEKLDVPKVQKTDGEFVLGEVYKIKNITSGEYRLLSDYGSRINPQTASTIEYHNGIDLQAESGTEVYAMFNGTVLEAGDNWAMGNFVRLEHGKGVISIYAHLSSINVRTGQVVNQYDLLGTSGSTGNNTTSAYLDLSLFINGRSVNPKVVLEKGNVLENNSTNESDG